MPNLITPAGDLIEKDNLRAQRAKALVAYLESEAAYATRIGLRALDSYDIVVVELDVERPQITVHDIASKERLAIFFDSEKDVVPSVLALREDFPLVPHINQTPVEKPRSLCLYDEEWSQARLSWTPARFIRRIRTWLSATAVGELHRDDQVLEPLIMPTPWSLVLPAELDASTLGTKAEVKEVELWGERTLVVLPPGRTDKKSQHLLFVIATSPARHGVIRRTPHNLKDLHDLLSEFGINLAESLKERVLEWKTATKNNRELKLKPIIVVALPKYREEGQPIETTEYHAFFSDRTDTMVPANRSRYGNGCRDISAVLSQDDVSLWASTASRALKKHIQTDDALVALWKRDSESGAVISDVVSPMKVFHVQMHEWTVVYDEWLQEKLAGFRIAKLPNETGGILIGHFDVHHSVCYLVDALPSPRDSIEWPEAYYRGSEGLRDAVLEIENKTVGQLTYVGEWHSHPDGCPVLPSQDDWTAYGWLVEYMNTDSYPGIMVIAGQDKTLGIVSAQRVT